MIFTNNNNLPAPIEMAIRNDGYVHSGDYSVTELIQPARMLQLTRRYADVLSVDISSRIWALLGSSVHYILQQAQVDNALQEERLKIKLLDKIITGKPDLYHSNALYDFKITSVWALLDGVKPEWEAQLNVYGYMLHEYGFPVDRMYIIAILRDWSKTRAISSGYPKSQVCMLPVSMWDLETIKNYIKNRVEVHEIAKELPDDQLPVCSPAERWERPTQYAVKKRGAKRAQKLCESIEEAHVWANEHNMAPGSFEIECRPGESVRCTRYCDCADVCGWWQEQRKEDKNGE